MHLTAQLTALAESVGLTPEQAGKLDFTLFALHVAHVRALRAGDVPAATGIALAQAQQHTRRARLTLASMAARRKAAA